MQVVIELLLLLVESMFFKSEKKFFKWTVRILVLVTKSKYRLF